MGQENITSMSLNPIYEFSLQNISKGVFKQNPKINL
jgi:hypothetical protein